MFVQKLRNIALVAFFILTIGFNLWLAASVDEHYIPQVGTYLALAMGTLCFGLLVPYLGFLFDTLTLRNLLDALQRETLSAVDGARRAARSNTTGRSRPTGSCTPATLPERRSRWPTLMSLGIASGSCTAFSAPG
jgi:uncharacterized membrane protein